MGITIEDKLKQYLVNSKVASYVFSDDVNSMLENEDITNKSWFLRFISKFVEENKKFEILSEIANNNCKILINRFRFLETTSISDKEKCNELLLLLNTSGSINADHYRRELFINSSFDQNVTRKKLEKRVVEDIDLEKLFNTCCDVVNLLFEQDESIEVKRIYKLSNNQFYFHCLIDMLNTIPELYVEEKYFSRLYAVLELNSNRRRKMRLDGEIGAENRKVKKHIKKELLLRY